MALLIIHVCQCTFWSRSRVGERLESTDPGSGPSNCQDSLMTSHDPTIRLRPARGFLTEGLDPQNWSRSPVVQDNKLKSSLRSHARDINIQKPVRLNCYVKRKSQFGRTPSLQLTGRTHCCDPGTKNKLLCQPLTTTAPAS